MAMLNPYQKYAQNQVTTATPEELTHLLYKGAVKFISLAIGALDQKNLTEANTNILKAQNIYYELLATLDAKYEISKNLASLYEYIIELMVEANIKKDKAPLEQALGMSKEFVEVWGEAIQIYRRSNAPKATGQLG